MNQLTHPFRILYPHFEVIDVNVGGRDAISMDTDGVEGKWKGGGDRPI